VRGLLSRRFPLGWRIARYGWPHRLRVAAALGLEVGGIALDLAKPLPLAVVVDTILSDRPSTWPLWPWFDAWQPMAQLSLAAAAMALIAVGRSLVTLATNALALGVAQRMVNDLRIGVLAHLQSLSLRFQAQEHAGERLRRAMADTVAIHRMVMHGTLPVLRVATMLLGMLVVMLWYDWLLALVALVVYPPLVLVAGVLTARIGRQAAASSTAAGNPGTSFAPVADSPLAVGAAVIVGLGAMRVLTGSLTIGELVVFLSYLRDLSPLVQNVSHDLAEIASSRAGLERVFAMLDVEADVQDAAGALPLPPSRGEIRFEHVSYAYDGGPPALRDINLHIAPGEHIAVVGRSGAGKSTLTGLVLRFFDPKTGRVTIDGHDLREVTLASLRRQVTLVLQEPIVLEATAYENIAWGARDQDPTRIREAARQTEAEAFILALPGGYDGVLGENGCTLSSGQRQRLALARALVRDTPVVILDEPTSALDLATASTVWQNIEQELRGHTVIAITQRLSTASGADRIVVLDEGTIVEDGTHAELLARRGLYFELWQQPVTGATPDGDGERRTARLAGRHGAGRSARWHAKFLIINADDFGYGHGVNRGIIELVDRGVVTSAGLMVNTPGTAEAVRLAAERPSLALGLHVNFTNEARPLFNVDDPEVCRRELRRQFDSFRDLTGRTPTHLDSHQHVHRRPACRHIFLELAEEHGLPLRDQPPVTHKGGFYSQWVYQVPDPSRVSFEALARILSTELSYGVYELAVHPGYYDPAADYVYHHDREWELLTLGDSRLPGLLKELDLRRISYHELGAAVAELGRRRDPGRPSSLERLLE
jgi:ATP-binding cassette subfamily B protein